MNTPFTDLHRLTTNTLKYKLECKNSYHDKFYEIHVLPYGISDRFYVVCRYGRIGTDGVAVIRGQNMNNYACDALVSKLRNEKTDKGYKLVVIRNDITKQIIESDQQLTRVNLIEF